MRLKLVFGVIAMLLALVFLGPIVFKLKQPGTTLASALGRPPTPLSPRAARACPSEFSRLRSGKIRSCLGRNRRRSPMTEPSWSTRPTVATAPPTGLQPSTISRSSLQTAVASPGWCGKAYR